MKKISYDILINLASEIANIEKEEKAKLPHKANIIDNIHICENAHSRILTTLLNYAGHDHSFPIYQTFIDLLKKKCCSIKNIIIRKPNIVTQEENIDILIDESPTYSIIIENKVCGAPDTETQIQRYVETVQKHNVANNDIFVVYLTLNGCKKVKDISLTPKAKDILDYDDKKLCRFIELNYKDDLLPLLESSANQIDIEKEPILYSSLIQYADFWKGRFCLRDGEKKITQKIVKYMEDKLNVNSVQDCLKISDNLESLKNALDEKQNELMKQVLNEKIVEPLKKSLGKAYEFSIDDCYLYIMQPCWKHISIYIGKYKDKGFIVGIYGGNYKSNVIAKTLVDAGYEAESEEELDYNKYVVNETVDSKEFWNLVDNGQLLKVLKKDIKKIIKLLEGRRL